MATTLKRDRSRMTICCTRSHSSCASRQSTFDLASPVRSRIPPSRQSPGGGRWILRCKTRLGGRHADMPDQNSWINRYEWRQVTTLERCAFGVFNKSVGDAMQIDYSALPSGTAGLRDGLHFYDELEAWKDAYEADKMVPDVKNYQTANETTKLLLLPLPGWAKGAGFNAVAAVMDPRLR